MAAKRKRSKAQTALSVSEFKAYITGITEFNGDDWAPSPEQWSRILLTIGSLVEVQTVVHVNQPVGPVGPVGAAPADVVQHPPAAAHASIPRGSRLDAPTVTGVVTGPITNINYDVPDDGRPPEMLAAHGSANSLITQGGGNGATFQEDGSVTSNIVIKTPSSDSDEPFVSGFID